MASSRLVEFLLLPRSKKRVLIAAWRTLWYYRIALWVLPYSIIKKLASGMTAKSEVGEHSVDEIMWAIGIASKFVPESTCLTQALAAKGLLSRNGYGSALWIGVDSSDGFTSHAWIESGGKVILGGPVKQYRPLYILE